MAIFRSNVSSPELVPLCFRNVYEPPPVQFYHVFLIRSKKCPFEDIVYGAPEYELTAKEAAILLKITHLDLVSAQLGTF